MFQLNGPVMFTSGDLYRGTCVCFRAGVRRVTTFDLTSLILASDVIAARRELAKRHIVLIPTTVRVNSIYFHVCCAVKAVKALDKSSQHKLNIRWGVSIN